MTIISAEHTRRLSAVAIFAGVNIILARTIQFASDLELLTTLVRCLLATAGLLAVAWLGIVISGRFRPRLAEVLDDALMHVLGWTVSVVIAVGLLMLIVRIALGVFPLGGA